MQRAGRPPLRMNELVAHLRQCGCGTRRQQGGGNGAGGWRWWMGWAEPHCHMERFEVAFKAPTITMGQWASLVRQREAARRGVRRRGA